ncbi:DEKNAAC102282 [Brettanomyces naardenensis]|uniref:DEKNAAC102282 n=1 Tax=Brettanomyces naardenensis TaxID=13370 RepID=A0A448YLD3_BRENA|nr:DEKNAAC102282 [Brettanomyces naardenensis]
MSDSRYDYDENSETWPYFVLTGLLVPLIPSTISLISNQISSSKTKSEGFEEVDWFSPGNSKGLSQYRSRKRRSRLFSIKFILVILGWILVAFIVFKIQGIDVPVSAGNFDPWKILGIDERANDRQIRTAYRKLSLKFHPDKVDTSEMSPKERDAVDSAYVMINKAYKALTDDAVKENFQKYGNPDGPGEIKHGIALPKFLIDGPTSPLFVVIYILLIAVILPLCVGKWWAGVKSHTKQGIYSETASHFLGQLVNFDPAKLPQVKTVLHDVSAAKEYEDIDRHLTPDKVYELLLAYLNRTTLSAKEEALKLQVVAITPRLLLAYLEIAAAFRNTDVCYTIVEAHRCIIQALNIEDDPQAYRYRELLQLPSVELSKIDKTQHTYTLGKLLKKPTESPEKLLSTGSNTAKVLDYARQIPLIAPLDCKFKIPGEEHILPNSHVHIDLHFVVKSPSQKSKPSEKLLKSQLEEPETLDSLRDPYKVVSDQPSISLANLPVYFPDDDYVKSHCGWAAFVLVQKDGRLGESPVFLSRADVSNLQLSQEKFLSSEAKVSVFKLALTAPTPALVGDFQFRLVLKNLVYFGSDIEIPLVMKVENKPPEETEDVYAIEEPEEDSLAGAMAQLRGQKVKKAVYSSDEEESEDESDSDESDWTDIDTDTEVEDDEEEGKK